MHTTPTNQPSLQEQVANLSGHLISLLMKYEGHDRAAAREIAIKMSELGSDYERATEQPAATGAAEAFTGMFGFSRVDEVLSIRTVSRSAAGA